MSEIEGFLDQIFLGDCISIMKTMPSGKIDLIFADPPYNIGIKYDTYNDKMPYDEYLDWSEQWLKECARLLSDNGSIYVAINDNYAAELTLIMKRLGLHMRNWIIWYYTFGQAMSKKFSRSHTHILYFTKDKKDFIFNADDIRVESVRQKIGDKRANPKGKVPDDVWKISRVAGTFKERLPGLPTQLPIELLQRVVAASSNPDSIVFDPFCGSGTTPYVAKQMGRKYISTEISPNYCNVARERLGIDDKKKETRADIGSRTAKEGYDNEEHIMEKINNWKSDQESRDWINFICEIKKIDINDIINIKCSDIPGTKKSDLRILIETKEEKFTFGIQAKKQNKQGYNHLGRRKVEEYVEKFNFSTNTALGLKKYCGVTGYSPSDLFKSGKLKETEYLNYKDIPEKKTHSEGTGRFYFSELEKIEQDSVKKDFREKADEIFRYILVGSGEYKVDFMIITKKTDDLEYHIETIEQTIERAKESTEEEFINVSRFDNFKMGKHITVQKKGGTGGADYLQFKWTNIFPK